MRGVVSLAAALSIPLTLDDNITPFPNRNIILFITFIVILFTLVIQGITLPAVLRFLKLPQDAEDREERMKMNKQLSEAIISHLESNYSHELDNNTYVQQLHSRYNRITQDVQNDSMDEGQNEAHLSNLRSYRSILIELIDVRRSALAAMRCERMFDIEMIRQRESELDFEEARLRSLQA